MCFIPTNEELGLPKNATQEERDAAIVAAYAEAFPQKDTYIGLRSDFSDRAVRHRLAGKISGLPTQLNPD